MSRISFMSANFVARQLGYDMTQGWEQGERAANDHFRPLATFAERFGNLLHEVSTMGFDSIDVWTAHLNWEWATDEHLEIARNLSERHGLRVSSMAGGFGSTEEEFESACNIAAALDARILGGTTPLLFTNREAVFETLRKHDLKLAIENHPEKNPREMLEKIGNHGEGRIGTALDTGWYATHGYDPVRAIEKLRDRVLIVHLKDVLSSGTHVTCRYGRGIVPVEECVRKLEELGYLGNYSVEHEPDDRAPNEDCEAELLALQTWLSL